MAEETEIKISAIAKIFYSRVADGRIPIEDIPDEDMRAQVQHLLDEAAASEEGQ